MRTVETPDDRVLVTKGSFSIGNVTNVYPSTTANSPPDKVALTLPTRNPSRYARMAASGNGCERLDAVADCGNRRLDRKETDNDTLDARVQLVGAKIAFGGPPRTMSAPADHCRSSGMDCA